MLTLEIAFLLPRALPASASSTSPQPEIAAAPAAEPTLNLSDPLFPEQWAAAAIGVEYLWQKTFGQADTLIAVLDSGIDESHPDLAGQVVERVNFTDSPTCSDVLGHGTSVAGIIAAKANGIGITGIAPNCRLLNVKVAGDDGNCQPDDMAEGIAWAVDHDARIINISIQLTYTTDKLESAVAYAYKHDVLIVAASGNNTPGQVIYPAAYPSCVAVSAVTPQKALSPLANYASWVDFVAPGYQLITAEPAGSYGLKTGTSFAAPNISGLAALLFSLGDASSERVVSDLAACSEPFVSRGSASLCINAELLQSFVSSRTN